MENCDSSSTCNKVSYDPGWNDPPSFAYNAKQSTSNRPKNVLNKRVAFPLSGGATNSIPPPLVNLPPMPSTNLLPQSSVHNLIPSANHEDNIDLDSESTLREVKEILINFLESSNELGSKAESIKKRIALMEDMWQNGKLNKQVQLQMKDLAYALKNDNPIKADDIHKTLMVDNVGAVCSWMPGVKQLIYHCIARSELLAIDKE